jgi:hypothetical protein
LLALGCAGPPPHCHPWEEVYVVLAGEIEVTIDGESHVILPGGVAHAPRHAKRSCKRSPSSFRARYFRDVHKAALQWPLARALAAARSPVWREVRKRRRAERLDAIRSSVAATGAPRRETEEATATLLSMSGAEFSWAMHDFGLPLDRIPGTIARTVQLIVDDLQAAAARPRDKHAAG